MKINEEDSSRSILVATDGSSASRSAAYTAGCVASVLHWSIHALHVVDASQAFDLYGNPTQEWGHWRGGMENRARIIAFREWGTLALAEVENICKIMNVPATGEMILGDVAATILKSSAKHPLLALGRRGNHHPQALDYLGRNFRRIVKQTGSALLIGGNAPSEFVRALLALDEDRSSQKALAWAERLQTMFSEVTTLCVEQGQIPNPARLEKLRKQIAGSLLVHAQFVAANGELGPMIVSTAAVRGADMIFMGRKATTWLSQRFDGSGLDTVLRHVNVPILTTIRNQ